MTPAPLVLLVDTREQAPWEPVLVRGDRRHVLPVARRALAVGDYSLAGYESEIAIERKSLADWIGTLFGATTTAEGERAYSWERFKREIGRANGCERAGGGPAFPALKRFFVIVEASREDVWAKLTDPDAYRSQVHPASVMGRSDSLFVDHGVPVVWAGSRDEAQRLALWSLVRWWEAAQHAAGVEAGAIAAHIRAMREPPARAPRAYDPGTRDPMRRAAGRPART